VDGCIGKLCDRKCQSLVGSYCDTANLLNKVADARPKRMGPCRGTGMFRLVGKRKGNFSQVITSRSTLKLEFGGDKNLVTQKTQTLSRFRVELPIEEKPYRPRQLFRSGF
jgi:hypothetical protein